MVRTTHKPHTIQQNKVHEIHMEDLITYKTICQNTTFSIHSPFPSYVEIEALFYK